MFYGYIEKKRLSSHTLSLLFHCLQQENCSGHITVKKTKMTTTTTKKSAKHKIKHILLHKHTHRTFTAFTTSVLNMANFKSCSYDLWIKWIAYVLKILKYFLEAEFKTEFSSWGEPCALLLDPMTVCISNRKLLTVQCVTCNVHTISDLIVSSVCVCVCLICNGCTHNVRALKCPCFLLISYEIWLRTKYQLSVTPC